MRLTLSKNACLPYSYSLRKMSEALIGWPSSPENWLVFKVKLAVSSAGLLRSPASTSRLAKPEPRAQIIVIEIDGDKLRSGHAGDDGVDGSVIGDDPRVI